MDIVLKIFSLKKYFTITFIGAALCKSLGKREDQKEDTFRVPRVYKAWIFRKYLNNLLRENAVY